MDSDDDPLAWIVRECKYSSSQEDCLRYCQFYGESQEDLVFFSSGELAQPDDRIPVSSTEILICSVPESSSNKDVPPEDDFQTPPEESLFVSSGAQRRVDLDNNVDLGTDPVDVDCAINVVKEDGCTGLIGTVDLGKHNDLGFSQEKSPSCTRLASPRTVDINNAVAPAEVLSSALPGEVYNNESKRIRLWKEKSPAEEDSGFSKSKGELLGDLPSNQDFEADVGRVEEEPGEHCSSVSKRSRDFVDNSEPAYEANDDANTSHGIAKEASSDHLQSGSLVKKKLELSNTLVHFVQQFCIDKVQEESPWKLAENDLDSAANTRKNIGIDETHAAEACADDAKDDSISKNTNNLEKGKDRSLENADIMEIAKQRGMTFPPPRWWPPKGF
uniref:Uncharacterized protein n=1 Tax=Nelumbo nucifera TaxID=4432 RepID=A0A823A0D8_NELNU|nr:TPA_asm: hypothetical protein HUJ06_017585 [Nelumbo nucifera]